MIERQLLGSELMPAVLAGIPVSRKDIDARKLDCPVAILEPDQFKETHDRGKLEGDRYGMNLAVVDLEDFDFPLPEECNRFLPMHDPQGFVRRVEQESHFHAATSFPTEPPLKGRPWSSLRTRTHVYAISPGRNQDIDWSPTLLWAHGNSAQQKDQRHA